MQTKAPQPWSSYCVGTIVGDTACQAVDTIAHTTHVHQAIEIVRSGTVSAGLVFDESKLKKTRIRVVWQSPNDWYNGFRYGSVQFHFSLAEMVDGMNAYYVETAEYNTPAPRILISNRDREKLLTPYNQQRRYGPWWHSKKSGKHYFNGNYTLEMMIESDLYLMLATKITFVNHHEQFCSLHPTKPDSCKELGCERYRAGGYFIARLVGEKLALKAADLLMETSEPSSSFRGAWIDLDGRLRRLATDFPGKLKADHTSAPALTCNSQSIRSAGHERCKVARSVIVNDTGTTFWARRDCRPFIGRMSRDHERDEREVG